MVDTDRPMLKRGTLGLMRKMETNFTDFDEEEENAGFLSLKCRFRKIWENFIIL